MKPSRIDILGFLILTFVIVVGYMGIVHRQTQQMSETRDAIAELSDAIYAEEGIDKSLKQDEAELASLIEQIAGYNAILLNRGDVDSFLGRFGNSMQDMGLDVTMMRPGQLDHNGTYQFIPVDIHVEGGFGGVYSLLREIEYGPAMGVVSRLNIQSDPDNDQSRATMTINLYLKPNGVK